MTVLERQNQDVPECMNDSNLGYFNKYVDWIMPKCKGNMLEIGCGLGYVSELIAYSDKVISIECTDKLKEIEVSHPKIRFHSILTEKMLSGTLFSDSMFDSVVCTEHIEHLEEKYHLPLLKWIKSHLTEGGIFLGSMPIKVTPEPTNEFHIKEYTLREWCELIWQVFPEAEVTRIDNLFVWESNGR